jgi:hypothetical protein
MQHDRREEKCRYAIGGKARMIEPTKKTMTWMDGYY